MCFLQSGTKYKTTNKNPINNPSIQSTQYVCKTLKILLYTYTHIYLCTCTFIFIYLHLVYDLEMNNRQYMTYGKSNEHIIIYKKIIQKNSLLLLTQCKVYLFHKKFCSSNHSYIHQLHFFIGCNEITKPDDVYQSPQVTVPLLTLMITLVFSNKNTILFKTTYIIYQIIKKRKLGPRLRPWVRPHVPTLVSSDVRAKVSQSV